MRVSLLKLESSLNIQGSFLHSILPNQDFFRFRLSREVVEKLLNLFLVIIENLSHLVLEPEVLVDKLSSFSESG